MKSLISGICAWWSRRVGNCGWGLIHIAAVKYITRRSRICNLLTHEFILEEQLLKLAHVMITIIQFIY